MISHFSKCLITVGALAPLVFSQIACDRIVKTNHTKDISRPLNKATDDPQLFQQENITDFRLANSKRVVLTFDDGPRRGTTDRLLDLLASEKVKATFFVVGENVRHKHDLLTRMADEGHIIANHTYDHKNLANQAFAADHVQVVGEIQSTHRMIQPFLSPRQRLYFRAPYASWLQQHANILNALPELANYIGPIYWDAGGYTIPKHGATRENIQAAADWSCWSRDKLSPRDCATGYFREIESHQGGVVLMHDLDIRTVELVRYLISWLKTTGYSFTNLDDLRALDQYQTLAN